MVVAAAAGCTSPHVADERPPAVSADWRAVSLPLPAGAAGRPAPREAIICGATWYLVGAVVGPDGATRPAAWASPDGATWTPVGVFAASYYGQRNVLYAVGCRESRIAAIGAKSGGAHGNPRVSTWYQRPDGALVEVTDAAFELYGGNDAVGVSRLAGGAPGWLIAGNRVSGAAVWVSSDATSFELITGADNLAGGGGSTTAATDVISDGAGWVVAGGETRAGRTGRDPSVWTSPDGRRWSRVALPDTDEDEVIFRLVRVAGGLLAVGVRGDAFGAWREADGMWRAAGRFGGSRGQNAAGVAAVVPVGGRVLAAVDAPDGHQLWVSDPDGRRWAPVKIPQAVPPGGNTAMTLAAANGTVLLITDDGAAGRVWSATFSAGVTVGHPK